MMFLGDITRRKKFSIKFEEKNPEEENKENERKSAFEVESFHVPALAYASNRYFRFDEPRFIDSECGL